MKNSVVETAMLQGAPAPEIVPFRSGDLTLQGLLWKPAGQGPFPAVLYNHGSAHSYEKEFAVLGPVFAQWGYVCFAPYRRGVGLSADQGEYLGDRLARALQEHGPHERSRLMVTLLETDHFDDQLAALSVLQCLPGVHRERIAVAGNSFGGIQTVLMAERGAGIRAAVDFAGAAITWARSPFIRERMLTAVRNTQVPIYFIQAANDHDLSPSHELAAEMQRVGKSQKMTIFPPFGTTAEEGHSFGYYGGAIWGPSVCTFLRETMEGCSHTSTV